MPVALVLQMFTRSVALVKVVVQALVTAARASTTPQPNSASLPAGPLAEGVGSLLDAGGRDVYLDDLTDCVDYTIVPKEVAGAQLDLERALSG